MLNTALIGLGRIGWVYHLPEILKHREYHLCAIADVDPSRLTEADEKCDARKYTDYREMLQKERPDVVVIASPTPFHKEQAIQAMREGCSVILDKPMASDLDSAKEIAAAAAEYQQKITVYQPHRFWRLQRLSNVCSTQAFWERFFRSGGVPAIMSAGMTGSLSRNMAAGC